MTTGYSRRYEARRRARTASSGPTWVAVASRKRRASSRTRRSLVTVISPALPTGVGPITNERCPPGASDIALESHAPRNCAASSRARASAARTLSRLNAIRDATRADAWVPVSSAPANTNNASAITNAAPRRRWPRWLRTVCMEQCDIDGIGPQAIGARPSADKQTPYGDPNSCHGWRGDACRGRE